MLNINVSKEFNTECLSVLLPAAKCAKNNNQSESDHRRNYDQSVKLHQYI